MCGIAGYINLRASAPVAPDESLMRGMLGMIRHRGPDQFGIYLDEHAALGNARLSIVDLAAGQQPLTTEDGRYWIVYNGEIFNHHELRLELEAAGHRLQTHCDTEVLLHLYEQHGPACLHRLNGQFAVAIWDSREKELFLARDRVGVRPLFYQHKQGVLVFGSEVKAMAVHPAVSLGIDPAAMDQIFTGWSCLPPGTVFTDVMQLPPGHFARVSAGGGLRTERYWQPGFSDNPAAAPPGAVGPASEADWLQALTEVLADATRLRLLADVPVGAYLSGGLDSSIIAALIRRYATGRIDTFSIAFTDSLFDESEHQRRMARHLGTDHQVVEASHEDIGAIFPEVIWHCETPILRTSPAPMFLLSRLVHRSGYKVVLTGEGADEFLAGYDIFKEAKIREFWSREPSSTRRPRLFQRIYPDLQNLARLGPNYLASFFGDRLSETGATDYSHTTRWRNTRRTQRFFSAELQTAIRRHATALVDRVPLPDGFRTWGVLDRAQYLEISTFLSPYLLCSQGDRVGMANSVEGRFPFLDVRMAELCRSMPAKYRLRGLRDKYLLRKLGQKLLPDDIWDRPKKPYRAPIHRSFFSQRTPAYVRELLSERSVREAGLFNPVAVSKLVDKVDQGQFLGETDDMALAGVISSQLVHHQFIREFKARSPLGAGDDVKVCIAQPGARNT